MADIIIQGPSGRLEARYHKSYKSDAPVVLVLHPHPLHGGSMHTKATYALYQTFVNQGFNTLRFNFRGVGNSEGVFDNGEGELEDAAAALDWLQVENRNASSFWIAGFSFGAWIAMQLLMRRPELEGFVVVCPPANMHDFNFLAPCPVSGLMVHGTLDTLVSLEAVKTLAAKLSNQKGIHVKLSEVEGADHFFTNQLPTLSHEISTYLAKHMSIS